MISEFITKSNKFKNTVSDHIGNHKILYIILLIIGYVLLMYGIQKYVGEAFLLFIDFFSFIENNDLLLVSISLFSLLFLILVPTILIVAFVLNSILKKWNFIEYFSSNIKISVTSSFILLFLSLYFLNKMIISSDDISSLVPYVYVFSLIGAGSLMFIGIFQVKEKEMKLKVTENIFYFDSIGPFIIVSMSFANLIVFFFGMLFYIYVYFFEVNGIDFVDFESLISYVTILITVLYVYYTAKMLKTSQESLNTTVKQLAIQEKETREKNIQSNIEFNYLQRDKLYLPLDGEIHNLLNDLREIYVLTSKNESFDDYKETIVSHMTTIKNLIFHYSALNTDDVNENMNKTDTTSYGIKVLHILNEQSLMDQNVTLTSVGDYKRRNILHTIENLDFYLSKHEESNSYEIENMEKILLFLPLLTKYLYLEQMHQKQKIIQWGNIREKVFNDLYDVFQGVQNNEIATSILYLNKLVQSQMVELRDLAKTLEISTTFKNDDNLINNNQNN